MKCGINQYVYYNDILRKAGTVYDSLSFLLPDFSLRWCRSIRKMSSCFFVITNISYLTLDRLLGKTYYPESGFGVGSNVSEVIISSNLTAAL